ncbi:hypothetical protein ABIB06_006562 [Bradyrhizobium sp. LB8.2]|uniref:hypothetical protein n=1 Tax=unclassified Bradyrhizobium TaxID=2631580 RepID=UPI003390C15E
MPDHTLVDGKELGDEIYQAIGKFIYSFSQLELSIRLRLGDALKLNEELSAVVVGPYDVATLFNVTKEVLLRTRKDLEAGKISRLFSRCHLLNQKARIVVAHGTWYAEGGGADHFSRHSFKSSNHFQNLEDLEKQITEAQQLMWHVVVSTGWKYDVALVDPTAEAPPL